MALLAETPRSRCLAKRNARFAFLARTGINQDATPIGLRSITFLKPIKYCCERCKACKSSKTRPKPKGNFRALGGVRVTRSRQAASQEPSLSGTFEMGEQEQQAQCGYVSGGMYRTVEKQGEPKDTPANLVGGQRRLLINAGSIKGRIGTLFTTTLKPRKQESSGAEIRRGQAGLRFRYWVQWNTLRTRKKKLCFAVISRQT